MCFDIKTNLKTQLSRVKKIDPSLSNKLFEKFKTHIPEFYHHVSGFSHPKMLIYTNEQPFEPTLSQWGLIPFWVKDENQSNSIQNKTLNARGETIFEKPSFRKSAKTNRCIIILDGFYEHHHFNGKSYPFFIYNADLNPISVAGLWDEWINKNTGEVINSFAIVTTKANELMKKIHNNPKSPESRMPVILQNEDKKQWLLSNNKFDLENYIKPLNNNILNAYSVGKLRGKNATGNTPKAFQKINYTELNDF